MLSLDLCISTTLCLDWKKDYLSMTEVFFEFVIVLIKLDLSLSGFLEYLGSIGSL